MKLYKIFHLENKSVDSETATLEAVFSTADEDRHGDVVEQDWDLKFFKKNPVILNSHNYDDAGEVIGKAVKASVVDGKLVGKIEFAVKENPKAKIIFDLYAGGFLNAFSVGFIPKEFDDKGRILKSELLEVSAVSVPANARALAKRKGIDVEALDQTINDNHDEERDDVQDTETEAPDGESPAGDSNGGEGGGGSEESAGEGDSGSDDSDGTNEPAPESGPGDQPEPEPQPESQPEPPKPNPEQVVAAAVSSLVIEAKHRADRKAFLLNSVAQIVNALGENLKVETPPQRVRAEEKRIVNSVIRQLIKHKHQ